MSELRRQHTPSNLSSIARRRQRSPKGRNNVTKLPHGTEDARSRDRIFPGGTATDAQSRRLSLAVYRGVPRHAAVNGAGSIEYCGTLLLAITLLFYSVRFVLVRSRLDSREWLKASIAYLPIEFLILVLGRN